MLNIFHQIYLFLFQTSADINIHCKIEYFSEAHSVYMSYCDFDLSENETHILNLPKRKVTAAVWRVIMFQSMVSVNSTFFEDDDDDDVSVSIYIFKTFFFNIH